MGFLAPAIPPLDIVEWKQRPLLERIKPLAQDWAVNGVGAPTVVYLLYIVKLVVFAVGGALVISASTPGLGGLGDLSSWWTDPIVFQKVVLWTMLWELVGLGAGSMPLTFRFMPPIGGILYWLRPGTIRLPPFPDRVPLTRGSTRTPLDAVLYAGVLGSGGFLLLSGGDPVAGIPAGRLNTTAIAFLLGFLALLGLRDKVSCLCARPELYGLLLVVFLFPIGNLIVASQLVLICIWLGAAASKLNKHFPFVVAVMISNTPWNRSRAVKRRLYRDYPEDLRPSRQAAFAAHLGTAMEFSLPLLLLVSRGGTLGTIAVVGMVIFHIHITSTFPLAVPLEWNLFMIFGVLFLFGHYGDVPFSTLDEPLLVAAGRRRRGARPDPRQHPPGQGLLPAGDALLRRQLSHEPVAVPPRRRRGEARPRPRQAGAGGRRAAHQPLWPRDRRGDAHKGLPFRAMHSHGRALNGLLPRAVEDIEAYSVREGELIAGVAVGWNFGDGHFHNEQLLQAVQERCHFADGELRLVTIESQPAHVQRQRYRIYDAATGLIEEGYVRVADMVERQPWLDDTGAFPVEVVGRAAPRTPGAAVPS